MSERFYCGCFEVIVSNTERGYLATINFYSDSDFTDAPDQGCSGEFCASEAEAVFTAMLNYMASFMHEFRG